MATVLDSTPVNSHFPGAVNEFQVAVAAAMEQKQLTWFCK